MAHFGYQHEACLEVLVKQSIKQADTMDLKALAVVVNSLAALNAANPVLMTITRQVILKHSDMKADHLMG